MEKKRKNLYPKKTRYDERLKQLLDIDMDKEDVIIYHELVTILYNCILEQIDYYVTNNSYSTKHHSNSRVLTKEQFITLVSLIDSKFQSINDVI